MDVFTPDKRAAIMRAVRTERTAPELALRRALHRLGFRFARSAGGLIGRPDLVLPKYQAAVFVHGCFWHGHSCPKGRRPQTNCEFWDAKIDRNRQRDRRVKRSLKRLGWSVITVWECQLSSQKRRLRSVERIVRALQAKRENGSEAIQSR